MPLKFSIHLARQLRMRERESRRLIFILVNQITTDTVLEPFTQSLKIPLSETHIILNKWSRGERGRELREQREQQGEIRRRENASHRTSSLFSQSKTPSQQAFCRTGGGLSGLSSLFFAWTRENLQIRRRGIKSWGLWI